MKDEGETKDRRAETGERRGERGEGEGGNLSLKLE